MDQLERERLPLAGGDLGVIQVRAEAKVKERCPGRTHRFRRKGPTLTLKEQVQEEDVKK